MSLSKSMMGGLGDFPKTDRNMAGSFVDNNKLRSVLEFIQNNDKQKSGLVPMANFVKILRIFGIQSSNNSLKSNEVGMVDYEKALNSLQV